MRERVRFILVTDNIDFALADVFASRRTNAPSFVRIIDDPIEILSLPERCKVHPAVWTKSSGQRSGAELAWLDRRRQGDLVFLSNDEMDKIAAWRARRVSGSAPAEQAPPPAQAIPLQQWT